MDTGKKEIRYACYTRCLEQIDTCYASSHIEAVKYFAERKRLGVNEWLGVFFAAPADVKHSQDN